MGSGAGKDVMEVLLRRQMLGPLILTVLGCFFLTSMGLYVYLSWNEPPDLLLQSNDWSQAGWVKAPRQTFEETFPPDDADRIRDYVKTLRMPDELRTQPNMPYDIFHCPSTPPSDYPVAWNVLDVLRNWNPANTTIPEFIYQGICVFDYEKDLEVAEKYRIAELPFVVRNTPDILRASERWNRDPSYLVQLMRSTKQKVEHSYNNHFMFWRTKRPAIIPPDWVAPTGETQLTYQEWLVKAKSLTKDTINHERWYFRVNAAPGTKKNIFLYDELPLFRPVKSFFMVDPSQQRGINCRFGMKGIIAETHFDQSLNFIAVMGGQRRYVLAHPKECPNMCLYDVRHPSGRHSAVDWTNPDRNKFPLFERAQVNEVVLQAGDILYLPTFWFHFIVSLNVNFQCNARSGFAYNNAHHIRDCGF